MSNPNNCTPNDCCSSGDNVILVTSGQPGNPGLNGINNGLVCLTGSGAPSNTLGADGDLYKDVNTGNLYGPKIAGIWGAPFEISGVAGGDLQGTYPNPTLIDVGTSGTWTKVTTDDNGRVTNGGFLSPSDIPGGVELQANKDQPNGYAGLDASTLLKAAEFPAFTGDVTTTVGGTVTAIATSVVSNSRLTNMAANTVKGNNTGISAAPQDITFAALATALGLAVTAVKTVKSQVFTSNGSYTPSTGMLYCIAEVQGGGGGGGGAAGVGSQSAAGGGGQGGGYTRKILSAATIGVSQTVTIGAAANGGTAGANNGTNGNSSSLGALLSATGGAAGMGGTSSASAISGTSGGSGAGVGSSGDINLTGGLGGNGIAFGTSTAAMGGYGGSSHFSGQVNGGIVTGAGTNGANYGGGGGGGAAGASSFAGGNGAQGIVIITEFCSQ